MDDNAFEDKLFQGDCLEIMKDIPDGSVDMVLCDLPYGVLNKGNDSAKWDVFIPFEPLWEQYLRVCKENAAIVLFSQGMFTAQLMMSRPDLWRYNLVWDKCTTTGFLNANRMPLRQHEDICIFYRSLPVYNPQMKTGIIHSRQHGNAVNHCYGNYTQAPVSYSEEYYPTSIIKFSKAVAITKAWHPTVKPEGILRYLILTYTNPGALVLDNTMGSGSTCVAAVKEHRRFIGIEKEKRYYDIAVKRVKMARSEPELF